MNRIAGSLAAIALSAATLLPWTAAQAQSAQKLEEVNYLLPAPPTLPAFAPWVLAQQRGYYAREGLKVNFLVAKGGVDVAKQVGAGNAPIGGGIGDTPIIVRAQGVPVKPWRSSAAVRFTICMWSTAQASSALPTSRVEPSR